MVVELQADKGMTLVAQRNIVYVDRGSNDGIRSGDTMEVIRAGGNLPARMVGEIKILSTEARTSAALVTRSTSRILPGDRFRTKTHEGGAVPVSLPVPQELRQLSEAREEAGKAVATEGIQREVRNVQPASRETRITLSELMRQLRYESGEATIRPEGHKVLDELSEYLKTAPAEQLIRVEGHADNMEIGPALKSRYPTNWDLSKARASGVLRYLIEKGGIDSARISSVGYGDTKPLVSNATEAGRQRNRRVDIVLYLPESDAPLPEQARGVVEDRVDKSGSVPSEKAEVSMASADRIPASQTTAVGEVSDQASAGRLPAENAAETAGMVGSEQPA
jgi:chemotaxis protein MotB